jgi:hypothetical protein
MANTVTIGSQAGDASQGGIASFGLHVEALELEAIGAYIYG